MNIFGNIMYQQNIDNDANFQSFPSAMLMLFRLTGFQWVPCIEYVLSLHSDWIIHSSYRIQGGENWNYLMTDCMVLQQCIEVTDDYNVTYVNATSPTLIWAGTYLDSVKDAVTLSLLPNDVKVGSTHALHVAFISAHGLFYNFCILWSPFAAQPLQPGSGSGCHLLCLLHVR